MRGKSYGQFCIVAVKVTYLSSFPLSSPNFALHIVASYKNPNWATLKCPAMEKAHLLSKLQNIVDWLSNETNPEYSLR